MLVGHPTLSPFQINLSIFDASCRDDLGDFKDQRDTTTGVTAYVDPNP